MTKAQLDRIKPLLRASFAEVVAGTATVNQFDSGSVYHRGYIWFTDEDYTSLYLVEGDTSVTYYGLNDNHPVHLATLAHENVDWFKDCRAGESDPDNDDPDGHDAAEQIWDQLWENLRLTLHIGF